MVTAHHAWRLQRIAQALSACSSEGRDAVSKLLAAFPGAEQMLELDTVLADCRVRKEGGRLFSAPQ
jgi:hypothetical protein